MKRSLEDDGRLAEVRRLAEKERALTREALAVREELAALVGHVLPPRAPELHVLQVVEASGCSRTVVDALRGGNHAWNAPARTRT